jgi:hypothetical protein
MEINYEHSHRSTVAQGTRSANQKLVVAVVPQGVSAAFTVTLVPGGPVGLADPVQRALRCFPRGQIHHDTTSPLLTGQLAEKLEAASTKVMAWLEKDNANALLLMSDPVAALGKARIRLSRSDQKALARAHGAVTEASVVPPGLRVTRLTVAADRKKSVPDAAVTRSARNPQRDDDCGC